MWQLIQESFSLYNIIPTILLGVVLLYWLVFIAGLASLDFMDMDFDVDTDVDADVDVDAHAEAGHDTHVDSDTSTEAKVKDFSFVKSTLSFFGLGKVPFMIWLSFFALLFWMSSLAINHFSEVFGPLVHLALLVPAFVVVAMLTRLVTSPFAGMTKAMNDEAKPLDLIGKIGKVTLPATAEKMGQLEVRVNGDVIRIYVKVHGDYEIKTGQEAVIFEHDKSNKLYYITLKNF